MPDVTLLELRITALDLANPAGGEPLEGLHERFLPELTLRGGSSTTTASTPSASPPERAGPASRPAEWRWLVAHTAIAVRGLGRRHPQPGGGQTSVVPVEQVAWRVAARRGRELTASTVVMTREERLRASSRLYRLAPRDRFMARGAENMGVQGLETAPPDPLQEG